jgi:hypothetical protein
MNPFHPTPKNREASLDFPHLSGSLQIMQLTQRHANNRAFSQFKQIPRRRREFIALDVLVLIRALVGSSRELIVFRAREQEVLSD